MRTDAIILVASIVLFGAAANAETRVDSSGFLPTPYAGDVAAEHLLTKGTDYKTGFNELIKLTVPLAKDEFETTAQYNARNDRIMRNRAYINRFGLHMLIIQDQRESDFGLSLRYDADRQAMQISALVSPFYISSLCNAKGELPMDILSAREFKNKPKPGLALHYQIDSSVLNSSRQTDRSGLVHQIEYFPGIQRDTFISAKETNVYYKLRLTFAEAIIFDSDTGRILLRMPCSNQYPT